MTPVTLQDLPNIASMLADAGRNNRAMLLAPLTCEVLHKALTAPSAGALHTLMGSVLPFPEISDDEILEECSMISVRDHLRLESSQDIEVHHIAAYDIAIAREVIALVKRKLGVV